MKDFCTPKLFPFFLIVTLLAPRINAQTNQWTYFKGDSIPDQPGVYGNMGTPAPGNTPGARRLAVSWTDLAGNFWLFGGYGYDSTGDEDRLNDLWKYNPATNAWAWLKGSSLTNDPSVYGIKGTPNSNNTPGARRRSSGWRDKAGNLWLFGGNGYATSNEAYLNDLWKYDVLNNTWTWVSGDNTGDGPGVYGTKGLAAATNKPGARYGSQTWADTLGNLWLFGGLGQYQDRQEELNDLWKYNITENQWTWVSGDSTGNPQSVYGIKGVPDSANKPGSKSYAFTWTDAANNLWLFGGSTDDLWKYNIAANQWTWLKGDSTANSSVMFGVKGTADSLNTPGARSFGITWKDLAGDLWLFGGYGNDVWKYTIAINEWTWVSGDSTTDASGQYGIQGTPSPFNKPGSRDQLVGWTDIAGNFWLFGGSGNGVNNNSGYLNDLWKFQPSTTLPVTLISFTGRWLNDKAALQWVAENEKSLKSYEVQRSFSSNGFVKINTVNANNSQRYIYYDASEEIHGRRVFYRLKKVDMDGGFNYSKIVELEAQPKGKLAVYPNPVTSVINLRTDAHITGKVSIQVIDMNGRIVQTVYATAGGTPIVLPASGLPPASYTLKLLNGKDQYSVLFSVQR